MSRNPTTWITGIVLAALFVSAGMSVAQINTPLSFTEITSPAATGSGEPNLTVASDGRVFLSWIESTDKASFLKFSSLSANNQWSAPQTIAQGDNWFVNWADFPSMIALPDGSLAAHWLAKDRAANKRSRYRWLLQRPVGGGYRIALQRRKT